MPSTITHFSINHLFITSDCLNFVSYSSINSSGGEFHQALNIGSANTKVSVCMMKYEHDVGSCFLGAGMYPRYDEKPSQDNDADHDEETGEVLSGDGDDNGDGDSETSKVTKQPSVTKLEEAYPYDRLKVSSSNPVVGIDTSKREVGKIIAENEREIQSMVRISSVG